MEDQLEEYIVTLYRHEDLEGFYEDMETPGGDLYIPDRGVNVSMRRPISRNTHYLLSESEAELLKKDKRVWDVDLARSLKIEPFYNISPANWDKSFTPESSDVNWGLLRCTEGSQIPNWGDDGTAAITNRTAVLTSLGRNVDVVITDTGHPNVNHPEFAVNPDGTGGSRCDTTFNWFKYNSDVSGGSIANSNYPYPTTFNTSSDTHGAHVTGIAAGNRQGWAKLSNIYNINITQIVGYIEGNPTYVGDVVFDYVRFFHRDKGINSSTGVKNPTIVNASWGLTTTFNINAITKVTYRGVTYTPSGSEFTRQELESYGIVDFPNGDSIPRIMKQPPISFEADIEDAINEGVIIVSSAGNTNYKVDVPGGVDYDNRISGTDSDGSFGDFYYHRGTLGATKNIISVSTAGNRINEQRTDRVATGPRNDIFAPGAAIISTVHHDRFGVHPTDGEPLYGVVVDPRDNNYLLAKWSFFHRGATSMASPQVTGVLACLLEHYPRMNQQDCRDLLIGSATLNQIGGAITDAAPPSETDPANIDWTSDQSLYGAPNRYLYYKRQRGVDGFVYPRLTAKSRNKETPRGADGTSTTQYRTGAVFPRPKYI